MFNSIDPYEGVKLPKCRCGARAVPTFHFGNDNRPWFIKCDSFFHVEDRGCGQYSTKCYAKRENAIKAWKRLVGKGTGRE